MNAPQQIKPGARVRVVQQVRCQDRWLSTTVEGEVVSFQRRPTGSWYAHGKDTRLWLDRLTIRKSDGEQSELVIDAQSRIELLDEPAQTGRD